MATVQDEGQCSGLSDQVSHPSTRGRDGADDQVLRQPSMALTISAGAQKAVGVERSVGSQVTPVQVQQTAPYHKPTGRTGLAETLPPFARQKCGIPGAWLL